MKRHFPGTQSPRDWFASQSGESPEPRILPERGSPGRPRPESIRAEPWPHRPGSQFPAKSKTCRNRPKSPSNGAGNIVESPTDVRSHLLVEKIFLNQFLVSNFYRTLALT